VNKKKTTVGAALALQKRDEENAHHQKFNMTIFG
jgi:hypothetical protein